MLATGLLVLLQATGAPTSAPTPPLAADGVRTPPSWDDFPVFVWREKYAGKPLPEELIAPFGGVILMREEDSTWARERGLRYLVWNVAGRDALHLDADEAWNARVEKWIATHDEKLLVREPCLNDPKTIERLHRTLDATLAKHPWNPSLDYVLGDEVSLTPNGDPFDLCRCAFCEAKWREYARGHGLPERAPLTDEVGAALLENDFSSLGAWLARRRFDQDQMLVVLEDLVRHGKLNQKQNYGSGPYVGLLGCAGQTAFGGVALERVVRHLGLIECYPVDCAGELAATAPILGGHDSTPFTEADRGPGIRLATLLLKGEGPEGIAWHVFNAWMRGSHGLVLWNDTELEGLSAEARTRLLQSVETVRTSHLFRAEPDGRHRPMRFLSESRTVAIVRDADSTALSFLRDALSDGPTWPRRRAGYQREHGQLERKVEGWLRLLEDCRIEPGALTLSSVCSSCIDDYQVLVLPEVLVVGDEDVEHLSDYVEKGGSLVIDGTLAWVDRTGRPRHDQNLRARLAGRHLERVLDATITDYVSIRRDSQRGTGMRRFVLDLPPVSMGSWEYRRFPNLSGEAARIPWLVKVTERSESTAEYLLLPNLPRAEDREALLRDVPIADFKPPEGYSLEWILPASGQVIRAGDVARLRLRPRAPR